MNEPKPKTETFTMRVPRGYFDPVDDWRRVQPDLPSRAEAIRRLVDIGLEKDRKEGPRMDAGQKVG